MEKTSESLDYLSFQGDKAILAIIKDGKFLIIKKP
jgi:hypothetical protein